MMFPVAYLYMHGFIFSFGIWSMINSESVDAMAMVSFTIFLLITCLYDLLYRRRQTPSVEFYQIAVFGNI